jgi:ACS family hexuronate transporter-like MFS transporter
VLVIIVLTINAAWQLLREWLPKFLQDQHGYTFREAGWFTSAYYVATDVGCITSGFLVKRLAQGGWKVHSARLLVFSVCALLTMFSVAVAFLPAGPLMLALLLFVGAGALGLFPIHYALTQDLSKKHQGKLVGILGALAWIGSSTLQPLVGLSVDTTGSFATLLVVAGLAPLLAVLALWLLWEKPASAAGTLRSSNSRQDPAVD